MIKWFSILWEYAFFTDVHLYGTILAHPGAVVNSNLKHNCNGSGRIK